MKKVITFLTLALFITVSLAQPPEGIIKKASVAPVINGELDAVWSEANIYDIDKPYRTEVPTLGVSGETTWRALWNDDGMFVFLVVNDDQWHPSYEVPGTNHWEFDKPELYFDVNFVRDDGRGAMHGLGHYQVAPAPVLARIDGTATTETNGIIWAYKVNNDKDYTAEYFIPWTHLLDASSVAFDRTGTMGFDVTMIDRDPGDTGRRRMVWANVGAIDESWSNMNDVGLVTLDGAVDKVFIDKITLTGGYILKDNGTLQIGVAIEPEDATIKTLRWSVVNKTGSARVDANGVVTAVADGLVTIVADATDGSWQRAEVDVMISGQITTLWEMNLIQNGLFNEVTETGNASLWGGWGGDAGSPLPLVTEGVAVLTPAAGAQVWQYQFNQQNLTALPNIPYTFSFVAWAVAPRTFTANFEDIAGNNHNRYGASTDPRSNGRSEWTFDLTTEPTLYTFDVIFDQMVANTIQKVTFMAGTDATVAYVDSVMLIADADIAKAATKPTAVLSVKMGKWVTDGKFNPATDYVDVAGNFNGWNPAEGTFRLTPVGDPDHTYTIKFTDFDPTLEKFEFKFRINSSWASDKHEFPDGGPNRELVIDGIANSVLVWFNDEGVNVREITSNRLGVYPNPARDFVNVVSENMIRELRIINAMGQVVHAQRVGSDRAQIAVGGFDRGIYFIQVMTEKGVAVERVMINR